MERRWTHDRKGIESRHRSLITFGSLAWPLSYDARQEDGFVMRFSGPWADIEVSKLRQEGSLGSDAKSYG